MVALTVLLLTAAGISWTVFLVRGDAAASSGHPGRGPRELATATALLGGKTGDSRKAIHEWRPDETVTRPERAELEQKRAAQTEAERRAVFARADIATRRSHEDRAQRKTPLAAATGATTAADEPSTHLADAVDRVRRSVLTILCDDDSLGSGFIFDRPRWAVTNHHVLAGARTARALRRDRDGSAGQDVQIVGFVACDPGRDLAVAVLAHDWKGEPLSLAPSEPRLGEIVFAIGSPKGLDETVTRGIVSQLRPARDITRSLHPQTILIQTDAFITKGSSGGPLCTAAGHVIGINTFGQTVDDVEFRFAVSAGELVALLERCDGTVRPLSELPPSRD